MPMKIPNVPSMCPEFHITYNLEGEGWRLYRRTCAYGGVGLPKSKCSTSVT